MCYRLDLEITNSLILTLIFLWKMPKEFERNILTYYYPKNKINASDIILKHWRWLFCIKLMNLMDEFVNFI